MLAAVFSPLGFMTTPGHDGHHDDHHDGHHDDDGPFCINGNYPLIPMHSSAAHDDGPPAGYHKMVFCGENYMMANEGGTHGGDCHDATGIKELHCGGMDHHDDHDGHDDHDDHDDECDLMAADCEACCAGKECEGHCGHYHVDGEHISDTHPEHDTGDM